MMMNLTFNEVAKYEPGIIRDLLFSCYEQILDNDLQEQFRQFDQDVFENLGTVGACTFITTIGRQIIGMGSYDPRQAPELGIIGHNCILPEQQGNGYGKRQILEIIRRLKFRHIKRATVTTSEHPFFKPACAMYLACGFSELERKQENPQNMYKKIHYEMELGVIVKEC
jgi:GNAT superfamily N-acetyltransferase